MFTLSNFLEAMSSTFNESTNISKAIKAVTITLLDNKSNQIGATCVPVYHFN